MVKMQKIFGHRGHRNKTLKRKNPLGKTLRYIWKEKCRHLFCKDEASCQKVVYTIPSLLNHICGRYALADQTPTLLFREPSTKKSKNPAICLKCSVWPINRLMRSQCQMLSLIVKWSKKFTA